MAEVLSQSEDAVPVYVRIQVEEYGLKRIKMVIKYGDEFVL